LIIDRLYSYNQL